MAKKSAKTLARSAPTAAKAKVATAAARAPKLAKSPPAAKAKPATTKPASKSAGKAAPAPSAPAANASTSKSGTSSDPKLSPKPIAAKAPITKPITKPAAKAPDKPSVKPGTPQPTPSKPLPAKPTLTKPAPAKPAPTKPTLTKPTPAKPAPGKSDSPTTPSERPPADKPPSDKLALDKSAPRKDAAPTPAVPAPTSGAGSGRKGITIVPPKPQRPTSSKRPPKPKIPTGSIVPPGVGGLLASGAVRKPLIPSGPRAAAVRPLGMQGETDPTAERPKIKTPFGKRDLDRFRQMLTRKRAELLGDVTQMEKEALQSGSGSLSNVPQHMAEQGSDTYDQGLSLDLAAVDRRLIKEIDDALRRIDDGTFGICEMTFKPIKPERLEELPWARYAIEAQRELERRSMRV